MTSRFNTETAKENKNFREENNWKGCVYGSPQMNNSSISEQTILFVLELNNDMNKIMGIGMVDNSPYICISGIIVNKKKPSFTPSCQDKREDMEQRKENTNVDLSNKKKKKEIHRLMVYKNGNYNRYIYIGEQRIDRSEMTEDEMILIKAFDIVCFTGNFHMKRGNGLKSFPVIMLEKAKPVIDIEKEILKMFQKRMISNL